MPPMSLPILVTLISFAEPPVATDGLYLRTRLLAPASCEYRVEIGGYIHRSPWYLPRTDLTRARLPAGDWTPWFDVKRWAGDRLHGRLRRAGGKAEFPNITLRFETFPPHPRLTVEIQLATGASEQEVVRHWTERIEGALTSVLVSPQLARDAGDLETATEMTHRRLRWAILASRGTRVSPQRLILQTNFWAPQRPELNLREARVLWWLGFNTVGNQPREVALRYPFRRYAHRHGVPLGPHADRDDIRKFWAGLRHRGLPPGTIFGINDEIVCRPPIGKNDKALRAFRSWLAQRGLSPTDFGVHQWRDLVPIETPEQLRERLAAGDDAARRTFYWTSRFRQWAATERLIWNTEEIHRRVGPDILVSTLVADHPYFAGTGLGMGMHRQNTAWGGWPLALDWFSVGRRHAVDLIGVEDWLGLQFMYGPRYTWEGFQLLGFQAAIFRSASRGRMPIMVWITPSDRRNLLLKFASAFAQGASHLFFWTYGPTATSTENYWSDVRSAYDGVVFVARTMALLEPALLHGRPRSGRVALLYSISSDLWQPYDYVHMLDRRGLYLALVHDHWPVDLITEEDVEQGALSRYRVLFTADPCIKRQAAKEIAQWVKGGGVLVASGGAGLFNEYGERAMPLASLFGLTKVLDVTQQQADYRVRGALNYVRPLESLALPSGRVSVVGVRIKGEFGKDAKPIASSEDGSPGIVRRQQGRGEVWWLGWTVGVSYIKDANIRPASLGEQWPAAYRRLLSSIAERAGAARLAELSHPVVEIGVRDSSAATAVILGNFTYQPIRQLRVSLLVPRRPVAVESAAHGSLVFRTERMPGGRWRLSWQMPLELADGVLVRYGGVTAPSVPVPPVGPGR